MDKKMIFYIISIIAGLLLFLTINKLTAAVIILLYVFFLKYPDIMYLLGSRKYSENKMSAAEKYFKRAYYCFYSSARLKIFYSYFLILQGKCEEAEGIIGKLENKNLRDTDKISVEINRSLILWKKNELDKAVEILKRLYEKHKTTIIYQNLGYFLLLQGDYEKALKFNQEAHEFASNDLGILDNLAQSYYFTENYNKSEKLYEELMKKNPAFASAYYNYALVLLKKNKNNEALKSLSRALKCRFNYLSSVSREEVEMKIAELQN